MIHRANQIALFFAAYPHDEAVAGVTDHFKKFWERRMRDQIIAYVAAGRQRSARARARSGKTAAIACEHFSAFALCSIGLAQNNAQSAPPGTSPSSLSASSATSITSAPPTFLRSTSRLRKARSCSTAACPKRRRSSRRASRNSVSPMKDVKILLNSHAHYDHCGGLAELKKAIRRAHDRERARSSGAQSAAKGGAVPFPAMQSIA